MHFEIRSFADDPARFSHALVETEKSAVRKEVRAFFAQFRYKCRFDHDIVRITRGNDKRSYHLRQCV